jgi:hypothetical protein
MPEARRLVTIIKGCDEVLDPSFVQRAVERLKLGKK